MLNRKMGKLSFPAGLISLFAFALLFTGCSFLSELLDLSNVDSASVAKKISDFPTVARKAIRVVQYEDDTKLKILKEYNGTKGYAVGFEGLMGFLEALLPSEEVITETIRKTVTKYPMIALREIIANALIHQDFTVSGSSPLVEIFQSRIEVTNPGIPLVDINRFTNYSQELLSSANTLVSSHNNTEMQPEHIMLALFMDENDLPKHIPPAIIMKIGELLLDNGKFFTMEPISHRFDNVFQSPT